MSFLLADAPAASGPAPITETLTAGQRAFEAAYNAIATYGVSFVTGLILAIIIYIIGAWVAGLTRSILVRSMTKRGLDETFAVYFANILHGVIMVLVVITALGELGIPTAQFAALIAAAGLAIGLALQGNLSNFASGFLLVFFRPIRRGDYLSAGGAEGTVDEIGIFTTTLTTLDNKLVIVPNSAITGGNIINYTAHSKRVVQIPCAIAPNVPIEKVRTTLLSITAGAPFLLPDPAVVVITQLAAGQYTVELRVYCESKHYWDALFHLNEAAKAALERDGIEAPVATQRVIQG